MKHRLEIDGLRAVAVIPVILFHAGFRIFSGGFIGVDVFFVLSGYLITRLILEELERGTFSITRFYARRARRILPALFCVMLLCIPLAWMWMLPSQYKAFSRSIVAVVMFVSNILFWRESGYFAAAAAEKPLLHTWSLGVEEQFYVFFPLALLLLWRFGRRPAFYGIVLAALLSLALCEYASRYYINVNYFLIPTRAWELFAGSLCAFLHLHSGIQKNNTLSATGLALILFAMLVYDAHLRLPSLYMLVPVVGTALVVLYGTAGTWVGRLLSQRLFVGIGLISYSAYLWHQPLFAFARIQGGNIPPATTMCILVALSLILAALTWRFVEQPFRNKQSRYYVSNRPALLLAGTAAALCVAAGIYGQVSNGRFDIWKEQARPNQVRAFELIEKIGKKEAYDNGDCLISIFSENAIDDAVGARLISCEKKYGSGIAIIGDSHAADTFFMLKYTAGNRPFMVSLSQAMSMPYSGLPTSYYPKFLALVQKHPHLFHHVIYEQSALTLFQDMHRGKDDYPNIEDLPLDATVPDYPINLEHIDAVAAYLSKLAPYTRVIWLGPHLEPRIRDHVIIHLGCDYPFRFRPNQERLFHQVDAVIPTRLNPRTVRYYSQIKTTRFDIARDFFACDKTYFSDGNHYSIEGEKYFSRFIILPSLMRDE